MEIDLQQFIPPTIFAGRPPQELLLEIENHGDNQYYVFYKTDHYNQTGLVGRKKHDAVLQKTISFDKETFEVIGLLQGEMSKTYRDMLTIANSEITIINKILDWFETAMLVKRAEWNWYLRFNIPEPTDDIQTEMRQQMIKYWVRSCRISPDRAYQKALTWTPTTKNFELQNNGTLMIEQGNKIFVQTIQTLVSETTKNMPNRNSEQIAAYLRGIIAAEGCVNYRLESGHRRVFVTACKEDERSLFRDCFHKLGIKTKDCKPIKDIIISGRDNILKLDELGLMTLHPDKHARFKEMIASYTGTWHERRGMTSIN